MRQENQIRRGELYYVLLDPCFGREIGGYKPRPVVVVSINDIHQRARIVAVVPGTTTEARFANVVAVDPDRGNGLRERTFFQCHQVRAIDPGRMTAAPVGRLARHDFDNIVAAVRLVLGDAPDMPA